MKTSFRLLLVCRPASVQSIVRGVYQAGHGCDYQQIDELASFQEQLSHFAWDCLIVETDLPHLSVVTVLTLAERLANKTPVIVLSEPHDRATRLSLLRAGADHCVPMTRLSHLDVLLHHEAGQTRAPRNGQSAERKVRRHGLYDSLTGLPTRALFNERLGLLLRHAGKYNQLLAIFFIDLDRFKHVNDTYGHERGDWLLQNAVKRMRHCLTPDDFLARLGGDEFLLLSSVRSLEEPAALVHRLIETLRAPFSIEKAQVTVTASIGISVFPDHGEDPSALLRCADEALYRAKHKGRDSYEFFSSAIATQMVKKSVMVSSLDRALRGAELEVYYQPQIDLETNRLASVEALVRWNIPGYRLIRPEEFMSVAERTGQITRIDEYVWRAACRTVRPWQVGERPVSLAINLSSRHFIHQRLPHILKNVCEETDFAPERLLIQISMAALLADPNRISELLRSLRETKVRLVLDHVCASTVDSRAIRTFAAHKLVIDRSLIWEMLHNKTSALTVQWLAGVAREVGATTLAEGIETEEQLRLAKHYGCAQGQGFLIARPMNKEDFVSHWLVPQVNLSAA
jgi:diguanylate cyclase (GGDEF)-like protein